MSPLASKLDEMLAGVADCSVFGVTDNYYRARVA
jgi:hypothetical protein